MNGACNTHENSHNTKGILWENFKNRGNLEDRVLDWMIILKWTLRKWDDGTGMGLIWLRIKTDFLLLLIW
jgi:hypothetical protein